MINNKIGSLNLLKSPVKRVIQFTSFPKTWKHIRKKIQKKKIAKHTAKLRLKLLVLF